MRRRDMKPTLEQLISEEMEDLGLDSKNKADVKRYWDAKLNEKTASEDESISGVQGRLWERRT